jgi:hypothetical protein
MKSILLDHCVPESLRRMLGEHDVTTAEYMEWSGLPDPDLLRRATQQFEIIITCDRGMPMQRPSGAGIAMIVLSPCDKDLMRSQLYKIVEVVEVIQAGDTVIVRFQND